MEVGGTDVAERDGVGSRISRWETVKNDKFFDSTPRCSGLQATLAWQFKRSLQDKGGQCWWQTCNVGGGRKLIFLLSVSNCTPHTNLAIFAQPLSFCLSPLTAQPREGHSFPALAWRRRTGGGGRLRTRASAGNGAPTPELRAVAAVFDDEMLWGPQGELPAASPHAPHHPPLLRRVAAASAVAGDPRRRLMARSASHGHPHQDLVVHHHHHHFHYYTLAPRAQWGEYPPVALRGMPALENERDWEVAQQPGRTARARVRRRRVPTFMRWLTSRRVDTRDDDSIDFSYEDLIELDARNVTRGLNADELGALETHVADSSRQECHICLECVNEGDKVVKLKCGHEYHQACIHTWLKLKRTCPICRCEL